MHGTKRRSQLDRFRHVPVLNPQLGDLFQVPQLGALLYPFAGWEGSPTRIDVLEKDRVPLF